ncbi:nucleoside triphosphate pyrophosphohydrolase [Labilibaculum filiforme]|uniref:Nucleoside triphosphate pyrophosphohydrolase n=1 Tax=Labilibaculum filiforme TaxID=1940526 RepID=A0A2N3HVD3_9BACT|nr:nucleoside triphosphate pyrophosphohydrolase [Labilibaculum filiforme]PKQ62012.1 nucleoside triphosphate pyrophosphohydrolase [Labilibaculum filiforme]
MEKKLKAFERLLNIMDQLREGCPWDKKQTFESLRTLTIEETYELADSILKGETQEIKKELGDILLHIVFYAKIGSETNDFDIADVCDGISEKLIYRHPHIFSNTKVANAKEVEENWEQLKLKEKGGNKTVLEGVPTSLPAMVKANRIQDKVHGVGFDWDEKEQVWEKVKEEMMELETEIKTGNQDKMEAEFGDMFFSLINAARLYNVNPENALERTNQKFTKRFNYLESKTLKQGRRLKDMNLEEMDKIWEEAKQFDK